MDKIDKKEIRDIVYKKYNGRCAYCGCLLSRDNFTIDHIKSKMRHLKGLHGIDNIENYNPCCGSCNSSKASYTIEEFRKKLITDVKRLRRDSSKYRILERFGILAQIKNELKFYFEKGGKDNER